MKLYNKYLALLGLILMCYSTKAQVNPLESQYFHNSYLANPAMAGMVKGLRLNLGYRSQWNDIPGAPVNQNLTLDYRYNKSGLGLSIINEKKAGLNQTEAMGTYVHHVKFNNGSSEMHFGLSMGIKQESYNIQDLSGNPNDPNARAFNDRKTAFDANFGMAYTSPKWGLEFAYYNMKNQSYKSVQSSADFNRYYLSTNYDVKLSNYSLRAKLAFREIRYYNNLVDLGVEVKTKDEKLTFSSLYHSNKSVSIGMGYEHNKQWQIMGFYNTAPASVNSFTVGSFELGMKFNLKPVAAQ